MYPGEGVSECRRSFVSCSAGAAERFKKWGGGGGGGGSVGMDEWGGGVGGRCV